MMSLSTFEGLRRVRTFFAVDFVVFFARSLTRLARERSTFFFIRIENDFAVLFK